MDHQDPPLRELVQAFTDELYEGYRFLARTTPYRAKAYLELVTMQGGLGAAQILLRGANASDGFTRLWQMNMLAYSLEAVVLKPKYAPLFTDDELRTARYRLVEHGFDVEGYLRSIED